MIHQQVVGDFLGAPRVADQPDVVAVDGVMGIQMQQQGSEVMGAARLAPLGHGLGVGGAGGDHQHVVLARDAGKGCQGGVIWVVEFAGAIAMQVEQQSMGLRRPGGGGRKGGPAIWGLICPPDGAWLESLPGVCPPASGTGGCRTGGRC